MTLTLAIDPGVSKGLGCALFDGSELACAWLHGGIGGCPHPLLELATELAKDLGPTGLDLTIDTLILEKPRVYTTVHQKGDQRDIINLAIVVGTLMASIKVQTILLAEPAEWKGQTPKHVTEQRAREALSADEIDRVQLPHAKSLHSDVWDGIALGLWHLRRMR